MEKEVIAYHTKDGKEPFIIELRLHFGKGYRIYCGEDGDKLVVLLIGGNKSSQDKDIKRALEYWRDHHEQTKI